MSLSRICKRSVDTALTSDPAATAAGRMRERAVGCLVVVDEHDRPVGMLTDRDLAMRVVAAGLDAYDTRVGAIMTPNPRTATEATSIEEAVATMRRGVFRRLPIVSNTGRLCGLVTLDDVVMLLAEELTQIGDLIGSETPEASLTGR